MREIRGNAKGTQQAEPLSTRFLWRFTPIDEVITHTWGCQIEKAKERG